MAPGTHVNDDRFMDVCVFLQQKNHTLSTPHRSAARRATYATGSGLRPSGRRAGRMPSGSGTGGGHSGHSANSGDSLADDDDDI